MRRFIEKAGAKAAEQFVKAGNFFWNSGMFVWGARTLADALREHLPNTAPLLEQIAASYGTAGFEKTFTELYPKCENISIDYAVLEPRSQKGEGASQASTASRPASAGMIWAHGLRSTNTARRAIPDGENVISSQQSFTLNAREFRSLGKIRRSRGS